MALAVGDFTATGVDHIAVATLSGLHLLRPSGEDLRSAIDHSLANARRRRELDLALQEELRDLDQLRL
eukprot:CAMPEP_0114622934 /NCGR_PEP_ID=MMETSP0168-20121206/9989_1 /TAXON_ID=95228 ORGANISM="Vannella sp., Strain DIVA3 517/6/12" /NCGR_SAMPLE_ID=MMETSP0168 /ASSEMBLY_ACC=CAM_ASM_000044 /LENGTH=67 /DNA_ID=CAMNT_0001834157 /DNA_START=20 /DNA_END=219 /DNA_ORIENTATION=+